LQGIEQDAVGELGVVLEWGVEGAEAATELAEECALEQNREGFRNRRRKDDARVP
jgi:hypothetical protein